MLFRSFINLSGGVGIPYQPGQTGNDIRAIGEGVKRVYEEVLVSAGMDDVAIYTEGTKINSAGDYWHITQG